MKLLQNPQNDSSLLEHNYRMSALEFLYMSRFGFAPYLTVGS